jgi:hypothetical protein
MTPKEREDLRIACQLVEGYLRTLGTSVCLIITPTLVELADESWAGSSTDTSLYGALKDALDTAP